MCTKRTPRSRATKWRNAASEKSAARWADENVPSICIGWPVAAFSLRMLATTRSNEPPPWA